MAQDTFSFAMDNNLKVQFEEMCENLGMNAAVVFNAFAKAVVREGKIPFEIHIKDSNIDDTAPLQRKHSKEEYIDCIERMGRQAAEHGLSEMTMEEIDEEIRKTRCGEGIQHGKCLIF